MSTTKSRESSFSLYGSLVLLWVAALFTGGIEPAIRDVGEFLQGNGIALLDKSMSFQEFLPYMLGMVAIGLPVAMLSGMLIHALLGKAKGPHAISAELNSMKEGKHFFNFFIGVGIEELAARGFFLGVLMMLPSLSGTLGLYVLFFLGNFFWSLLHLSNFGSERDRHWLRVVPQLVAGVFFTVAFLRFGLLGCILCHFAYNAILFSVHRVQRLNHIDIGIALAGAGYALFGFYMLEKPLSDVLLWLQAEPLYALPGWAFWDYMYLTFIVTGVPAAMFGALLYDRPQMPSMDEDGDVSITGFCFFLVLGSALMILIYYGLYALLGLAIVDAPIRILIMAILVSFCTNHRSASAVSATFWSSLPSVFVSVCILYALGFWTALLFVLTASLLQAPLTILRYLDD